MDDIKKAIETFVSYIAVIIIAIYLTAASETIMMYILNDKYAMFGQGCLFMFLVIKLKVIISIFKVDDNG
jgi:hypothetical protein